MKKSYTLSHSPEENNYNLYITEETILQSIQTYSTDEKIYILWLSLIHIVQKDGTKGPRLQFKEALAVGFQVTF